MSVHPSTAQAQVVVDELIRNGLRHLVVCPGSRNAPISVAAHHASRSGRLTLHVRIDERSAAFLALGLSRGMGHGPRRAGLAGVVCTSGTAVANLHPAVLEAAHTGEPLVLLTADRPPELIGSGANQTTTQHGMFSPHVATTDFPLAERREGQNAQWRGMLCRLLAGCRERPLHLNLPFREPLLPEPDDGWPETLAGRDGGGPWTAIATSATQHQGGDVEAGDRMLRALGPRTLVLVGDAPWAVASEAGEVARRMDWPLLVEPPGVGPRHALSSASLAVNSVEELPADLRPDAIVVVGRPTLSRGVSRLLRSGAELHLVCTPEHWGDSRYQAVSAVPMLDTTAVDALPAPERDVRRDSVWTAGWRKADVRIAEVIREWLADTAWPTGAHVARELLGALPSPAVLFLGSSNAVRDVDLVTQRRGDLTVLASRGLAGIDGAVSTAIGATRGAADARDTAVPGYALLGDLSFLHDAGGLLLGRGEPEPDLTLVVNNDRGGGIFSLLEQGDPAYGDCFERVFGTPHDADIGALCAGYGVRHTQAATREQFVAAVAPSPGLRVVEVRTDRDRLRPERAALHRAVADALTAGS